MDKKAFSLVEMIITITLLVLLATVGFSMAEKYQQNKTNTKVQADLATLSNAFTSYKAVEKKYPDPIANKNYFTEEGMYSHDEDAFGVHGFITSETLPNKYLNFVPVDIKTNQYYAFGKTVDLNNQFFEIAGVLQVDGNYMSKVYGDYTGETGPYNLIREYNGPSFVADESPINFPYNPDEKLLTAKIGVYSGSIFFGDSTIPMDDLTIESTILRQGNSLTVMAGSFVQIYYSDGSMSTLGDDMSDSTLIFANMEFVEDNNLYTQIKLALKVGSLWTSAAKLDSRSTFEVYTTDTSAAVRGTVFGVTKTPSETTITVVQGKVQVGRFSDTTMTIEDITEILEDENQTITIQPIIGSAIPGLNQSGDETFLQPTTADPVGVTVTSPTNDVITEPTQGTKVNPYNVETNVLIGNKVAIVKEINTVPNLNADVDVVVDVVADVVIDPEFTYFGELGDYIENSLYGSGYDLVAYAPYDTSGDLNLYIYNDDLFEDSSNNIRDNTYDFTSVGCDSYDEQKSFCTIGGENGIFIDKSNDSGNEDSLIYNISDLTLLSNFAIEMSVRGAALNRTGTSYFLFNTINSIYKLKKLTNGYIQLLEGSTNKGSFYISDTLANDTFYKVIFIKDGIYGKIIIKDINGTIVEYSTGTLNNTNTINSIYIGSDSSNNNQWNDIIDYVKIYTK